MSEKGQGGLYKLVADYGTSKSWLQSTNLHVLRMFGNIPRTKFSGNTLRNA
jgi:hypothetical protein